MTVSESKENLIVPEVAELLGICQQRVRQKLIDGHFPNAFLCPCERTTLIPRGDLKKQDVVKRRAIPPRKRKKS